MIVKSTRNLNLGCHVVLKVNVCVLNLRGGSWGLNTELRGLNHWFTINLSIVLQKMVQVHALIEIFSNYLLSDRLWRILRRTAACNFDKFLLIQHAFQALLTILYNQRISLSWHHLLLLTIDTRHFLIRKFLLFKRLTYSNKMLLFIFS